MKKIDSINFSKKTERELTRLNDHIKDSWYTASYFDDRKICYVYSIYIPISNIIGYTPFKIIKIIYRASWRFCIDFINRIEYK
jgi:hypothetical protein